MRPGAAPTLGAALLTAVAAACVGARTDAEAYHYALTDAETFASAAAACDGMSDPASAVDCRLASIARFEVLEDAACASIADPRLLDECRFQLAERRLRAGDLPGAIATCDQTRFRRPCSWHLVRDVSEGSREEPMAVAEAHIAGFRDATAIPDAAKHFWIIRFRADIGHKLVIDERNCERLQEPFACRDAMYNVVLELLKETALRDRAALCARPFGERIVLSGVPVWRPGPITRAAEGHWAQRHCPGSARPADAPEASKGPDPTGASATRPPG